MKFLSIFIQEVDVDYFIVSFWIYWDNSMFSFPFIFVVNLIYFCRNNSNNWSWNAIFFNNIRLILLIFCLEFLHLYLWMRLICFVLPLLSFSVSIIPSLFKELRNNPAFSVLWWDWNYVFLHCLVECSFKTIRVWYFLYRMIFPFLKGI